MIEQRNAKFDLSGQRQAVLVRLQESHRKRKRRKRLLAAICIPLAAIIAQLVIETSNTYALAQVDYWGRLMELSPLLVILGSVVIGAIGLVVYGVTQSLSLSIFAQSTIALLFAFSHVQKMSLRGEPLFPQDMLYLTEIVFLFNSLPPNVQAWFISATMCLLLLFFAIAFANLKARSRDNWVRSRIAQKSSRRFISRGISVSSGALILVLAVNFSSPGNPLRSAFAFAGAENILWSQLSNYSDNGAVAAFLLNIPGPAMVNIPGPAMGSVPSYSQLAVEDAIERWSEEARKINIAEDRVGQSDLNIIVVLSESFADPLRFPGAAFDSDPIPFTRSILDEKGRSISGKMVSSGYGGGTADVEWEVISGFHRWDLSPSTRSPFTQHIAFLSDYPSFLDRYLKAGNVSVVAIHPFYSHFYQRDKVYRALGINETYFLEDIEVKSLGLGQYVADEAGFNMTIELIERSPEPLFVHYLTMQNHSPYAGIYDDPLGNSEVEELGQWARGLAYSDNALRGFLNRLEDLDEPSRYGVSCGQVTARTGRRR